MLILTMRTDKPEAELGLFDDATQLAYETWQAHRQLAETIHIKLHDVLQSHSKELHDIQGIVVFKGPGSFTGLRIGLTVANTLADALLIPIVATNGNQWTSRGITKLENDQTETIALPEYGAEPHITQQKK